MSDAEEEQPDPAKSPGVTTKFDLATLRAAKGSQGRSQPTLTITAGAQSGKIVIIIADRVVLGRSSTADVALIGRGISREHACVERIENTEASFRLRDLGSTNGTLVDKNPVTSHGLADGDHFLLGPDTSVKFSYEDPTEVGQRARRYEESIRDDLTGIYNRRYFMVALNHELAYSARHAEPTSVAILDVDRFKRVNDGFGHSAGDLVLKRVAAEVEDTLRREDIVARYGGEEFVMCLRGLDRGHAFDAMERVRERIASLVFRLRDTEVSVTCSIGLGCVEGLSEITPETVLEMADRNLYTAKRLGRNRTCVD